MWGIKVTSWVLGLTWMLSEKHMVRRRRAGLSQKQGLGKLKETCSAFSITNTSKESHIRAHVIQLGFCVQVKSQIFIQLSSLGELFIFRTKCIQTVWRICGSFWFSGYTFCLCASFISHFSASLFKVMVTSKRLLCPQKSCQTTSGHFGLRKWDLVSCFKSPL